MKTPPEPPHESERLEILRRTALLDTPPEPAFDDLTRLTSFLCGTPVALVSLVDERRQWFKSRVGFDVPELPREVAFCAHAIAAAEEGLFVVRDALMDDRFADSPVVISAPRIRFYAGAPLRTAEGHALGTLCVIDHVPRDLGPEQRFALQALSRQVMAQIELRRATAELSRVNAALAAAARDAAAQKLEAAAQRDAAAQQLEAAARDAAAQKLEPRRAGDEFIASVSHELRMPLTSMRGAFGLLEGGVLGELSAEAMDVVQIARSNADRLIHFINDLLDLQRIEEGQLELAIADIETPELVRTAVETIKGMAKTARVELRTSAIERRAVRGDEPRLRQVLASLLSHAVKRSRPGNAVDLRVAAAPGARVRFEVKDQGPRIAPSEVAGLFGRLQRDAVRPAASGLGLAIARAIVEQHGGAVGATSRPGEGATLWFDLPAPEIRASRRPAPPDRDAEIRAALAELRAEYASQLPDKLQDLANTVQRARRGGGDAALLEQARSKAHRIFSTAGSYGFSSVSAAAERIEASLAAVLGGEVPMEHAWGEIASALAAALDDEGE